MPAAAAAAEPKEQTITFKSTAPSPAGVGEAYVVKAEASSALPVTLALDGTSSGCALSEAKETPPVAEAKIAFTGEGTCKIDATQTGNAEWKAAPEVQEVVPVSKKPQTIKFTSKAEGEAVGKQYTVAATAPGGEVSFTSSTPSVCTLSGSTVSFVGSGECTIDAHQAGNGEYAGAPELPQTFSVAEGSQEVKFTSSAPSSASVGDSYSVSASGGGSGNAVVFTIDSSSASVCSVSDSTVRFTAGGTCTIDANQPGAGTIWAAAPQAQQSFSVAKKSQTISFTGGPPVAAVAGGAAFAVAASTTSGLTVALTVDSASKSVCAISGAVVTFVGPGTCTIEASQAGNGEYAAAQQVQLSFTVAPPSPPPPTPDSNFTTPAASVNTLTGKITFKVSFVDPGTFTWLFTFQNGKFGVFSARAPKCRVGYARLAGACRPLAIMYSRGHIAIPGAGTLKAVLTPSTSARSALRNALNQGKGLRVTATFTFQSSRGGTPVTRTETFVVKLRKR